MMFTQRRTGKSTALRELAAKFGRNAVLVVRDARSVEAPTTDGVRYMTFAMAMNPEKTNGLNPPIVLIDDAEVFIDFAQAWKARAEAAERRAEALTGYARHKDDCDVNGCDGHYDGTVCTEECRKSGDTCTCGLSALLTEPV